MGRLVAHVESYAFAGLAAGTHVGMPSTTVTVVVSLDEPLDLSGGPLGSRRESFAVSVAGLHTAPVTIHHTGRMRGLQLDLTPAGCRAILGCPAGELADQVHEGAAVLGDEVNRLREHLHESPSSRDQFSLAAALFNSSRRTGPMDDRLAWAWAHLHATHGRVTVADLADDAGWSTRHFTQRFTREFGHGPKTTSRVLRFGRSVAMVRHGIPAAEVATRCGYADQAHFVREWRRLAGTTPGRWPDDDELAFVQDGEPRGGAG